MRTSKSNVKNHRASQSVDARRASRADFTPSETDGVTPSMIEFLKELSISVDAVAKGLMNMPSQVPAIRGRFVAMLSQIQTKIDGKLGIEKRVSTTMPAS